MKLTTARHTALARLSDGEWRNINTAPTCIAAMYRAGYIRCNREDLPLYQRSWTITPKGLAALKGAGE